MRAQPAIDSIFKAPSQVIRSVPQALTDIEVDQEGNILLLSQSKHKVHKYFYSTGYDSLLSIGGKGIKEEGFNLPSKIDCPNRQNTYVLDLENRRIAVLNVNLKVIRDIDFLSLVQNREEAGEEPLWPISFAVGPTGELFLLNQEDNKIIKFNSFGQEETRFGGLDYGAGSLSYPSDLVLNYENRIFVADTVEQKISIFNLFGIYLYSIPTNLPFRWSGMTTFENYLICFDQKHLYVRNLFSKKEGWITLQQKEKLVDVTMSRDFFYLLFENSIHLYRIKGN